jgi:hypothetical protein
LLAPTPMMYTSEESLMTRMSSFVNGGIIIRNA